MLITLTCPLERYAGSGPDCLPVVPAMPNPRSLRAELALLEGRQEDAACQVLAVVQVHVDAAAVGRAVGERAGVAHDAAREVAVDHDAHVTIRHEGRRERALDECDRRRGLQALQADGGLELPHTHLELRRWLEVEPGVLQHGDATSEVGHQAELEVPPERALQDRPHAPQREGVDRQRSLVAREEAAVELDVAAQLQAVVAAVALHAEAFGSCGRRRARLVLRAQGRAQKHEKHGSGQWYGSHSLVSR